MVRSARELGAGLAGDARALWPNTARSESKLPEQAGPGEGACARVCARVCEPASGRAGAGGPAASHFPHRTEEGERARGWRRADPPGSPEAAVPPLRAQAPQIETEATDSA